MSAEQLLREGRLDEALAKLKDQIRNSPENPKYRIFLFQMLAVDGLWDRALTQLNTAAELDTAALGMAQMYRTALECEALRSQVFAGQRMPLIFGEPENWIALLVQALGHLVRGELDQAAALREQAYDQAPATSGTVDGQSFEWIADADSRLGPILEAIVNGRYYWIPFHRIQSIVVEAPVDLRDVVWLPAHFTWSNGGELVGLIPSRYPGSEHSDEPAIRLARKTVWQQAGEAAAIGLGQRMLATDGGELALLDVRRIDLMAPLADSSAVAAETP
jgi:type VI secretion system protein ImpE